MDIELYLKQAAYGSESTHTANDRKRCILI